LCPGTIFFGKQFARFNTGYQIWGFWMSRGFCGKLGGIMKMLRFICLASLLALIFALGGVSDAPLVAGEDSIISTTPTTISTTEEDPPSCSATITITWTTVGPPEE